MNYESYGSTTWKVGVEPDNCFYFQNEAKIRGKLKFDLTQYPPPDLALEIDMTSKSLGRFPIYARLGVPEIWTYDSGELKIYQLQGDNYLEVETSSVFPMLRVQEVPVIIEEFRPKGRRAISQAVRNWVRKSI